jgi:hypothetical protein
VSQTGEGGGSRWAGPGLGDRIDDGWPNGARDADWPESVRVVGFQPSLWWGEPQVTSVPGGPGGAPLEPRPGVIRLGPEALVVGAEIALSREIGQSFYLMGLMALALSLFVGLGLLLVRVLA